MLRRRVAVRTVCDGGVLWKSHPWPNGASCGRVLIGIHESERRINASPYVCVHVSRHLDLEKAARMPCSGSLGGILCIVRCSVRAMIITLWVQADALVHRELHRYLAAWMVALLGSAVEALSPLIREEGSQAYRVLVLRCITVKRISGRAKLALLRHSLSILLVDTSHP